MESWFGCPLACLTATLRGFKAESPPPIFCRSHPNSIDYTMSANIAAARASKKGKAKKKQITSDESWVNDNYVQKDRFTKVVRAYNALKEEKKTFLSKMADLEEERNRYRAEAKHSTELVKSLTFYHGRNKTTKKHYQGPDSGNADSIATAVLEDIWPFDKFPNPKKLRYDPHDDESLCSLILSDCTTPEYMSQEEY